MLSVRQTIRVSFNPRTHVGCDFTPNIVSRESARFNPRTHVGCDLTGFVTMLIGKVFQSTHPRRVRLHYWERRTLCPCFNPRTHVGCDRRGLLHKNKRVCFNPRTHVGCDRAATMPPRLRLCFNPRTHVGCDFVYAADKPVRTVSIHAPT